MGRGSSPPVGRGKRLLFAFSVAIAATAVLAPAGQANFTTGQCQGTDTSGRGASFANAAHAAWKTDFQTNYCDEVGVFPQVTYDPAGSGAGRRVVGERTGTNADGSQSRNQAPRFGMSDEPPTPTAVGQMNQGTDTVGDEGTIHVVPGAVGAVAALVNFPNNCDRSLLPDSAETNPASANSASFIDRVRFTRTQYEAIWNGDSANDNWTEVFPTLAADADCNKAITRVVRFDDSGTTFAFKAFLDKVNPVRNWDPGFTTGPDTRNWPNASLAPRADCAGSPTGPTGPNLTSGCSNGNGSLVSKLSATDGGVGYSDIATARSGGYAITPAADAASRDDDLFWTEVTNPSGQFVEATADPNGFRTDGLKGANCQQAVFANVPASTLGDWQNTDGTDSAQGWVICTLTYGLVWDDNKPVYSLQGCGTSCEEQKARSVKDYWSSIVSDSGQDLLFANDYAQLPDTILNISRTGINAVCWDKAGSGACPVTRYLYARPKGASPLYASLVVAYNQCTVGNRVHAAPLAFASCNPGTPSSGFLTVGSPDANGKTANAIGSVKLVVVAGNPATPADEADVLLTASITDVRNQGSLTDYTGQVQVDSSVRITDRSNGVSQGQGGTVQDISFPATVPCAATVDTTVGGTCSVSTTFDAVMPGAVKENKRAIWEMGQIVVNDGGADGVVSTTPNTQFMRQGVFAP